MLKPSRIFFFLTTFILINLNNCFASDADVLFDWAEGQYPQLFAPSPSPTLTDLQDWEYRIYNETGTAIGIEKGQKIYVTGGSFGTFMEDIIFVGNTEDLIGPGIIQFTVEGGTHAGKYGGKIEYKESYVQVIDADETKLLAIRLVHHQADDERVVLGITLYFDGEPGVYELQNTLSQAGVSPSNIAHNDDRFFTVSSALDGSSGTINIEEFEAGKGRDSRGSVRASFIITDKEGVTAKGSFIMTPLKE